MNCEWRENPNLQSILRVNLPPHHLVLPNCMLVLQHPGEKKRNQLPLLKPTILQNDYVLSPLKFNYSTINFKASQYHHRNLRYLKGVRLRNSIYLILSLEFRAESSVSNLLSCPYLKGKGKRRMLKDLTVKNFHPHPPSHLPLCEVNHPLPHHT